VPSLTLRRSLALVAATCLVPLSVLAPAPDALAVGPECDRHAKTLTKQAKRAALKNRAALTRGNCGYRYHAGPQASRVKLTEHKGGLLIRDTGTRAWKRVAAPCERRKVSRGVAAWCPLPETTPPDGAVLVEVWLRGGHDHLDASALSESYQVSALMGGGRDVVLGGAGHDFVDGGSGRDRIRGGGGNDLLRGGGGDDEIDGGPGQDSIRAGAGADAVTSGDSERDVVDCGAGRDRLLADPVDERRGCEQVTRYVPPDGGSGGGDSSGGGTGGGDSTGGDQGPGGDYDPATWGSGPIAFGDATTDLPKEPGKYPGHGPSKPYVHQIMIGGVVPLKDEAIINPVPNGYLFRAGQQHNDLTIKVVDGRLHFLDEGTLRWKWLPAECQKLQVPRGVGASCVIPQFFTESNPMLIEVWPRLGDDTLDTTALSAAFDVTFLGDWGHDTVYLGAGNNFVNAAQDKDLVYGGSGNDWLRGGLHDDVMHGGAGNDYMVGQDGNDTLYGGAGDDALYGSEGADKLHTGTGSDRANCGSGTDSAWVLFGDRVNSNCENVTRS
jgi:serralysin